MSEFWRTQISQVETDEISFAAILSSSNGEVQLWRSGLSVVNWRIAHGQSRQTG